MILEHPRFLAGLSVVYLLCLSAWISFGFWLLKRLLIARRRVRISKSAAGWLNLAMSSWFLLAGLTLVEMYFSLIYDQTDSFNMTKVSQRWFARHVEKNADGWRDKNPLAKTAPKDVHRIWISGDSFTYGHGVKNVNDRFSDQIAQRLEAAHPGRYAVSNVADAGINIAQVEKLIHVYLDNGYRFNTLVYVICLNDIEPYVDERGERYKKMEGEGPPFILRETYFFSLLWYRIRTATQPNVRNYYSDLAEAYDEGEPRDRFLQKLDELHALCSARKIDLRIAIFPFLHNLGPKYPFTHAHQMIVEHCRNHEIPVLDLAPILEPHLEEGLIVNQFDPHPNERAHRLAAEAIERYLLADYFR